MAGNGRIALLIPFKRLADNIAGKYLALIRGQSLRLSLIIAQNLYYLLVRAHLRA